jgi:nucleoside-diphosphate-sugar epimerase
LRDGTVSCRPTSPDAWFREAGQKDDPVRRNPDIRLAQKLLGGWTPQVPLERGLEATIAYFRGLNGRPQG